VARVPPHGIVGAARRLLVREPRARLPLRHRRRHGGRSRQPSPHHRRDAERVDGAAARARRAHPHAHRARVARLRPRGHPRRRQRVRHPGAAVVPRRDGRARGSDERDRAQLVDGERRARRRAGDRRAARRGRGRGLVLSAERPQLHRRDRGAADDGRRAAAAAGGRSIGAAGHRRGLPLRRAHGAGSRAPGAARRYQLLGDAVLRPHAGVRRVGAPRRAARTRAADGRRRPRRARGRAVARPSERRARAGAMGGGRLGVVRRGSRSRSRARSGCRRCC